MNRIISKEEEREDPRRELQSSSSTVVFPQILQELQCFHTQSSHPVQKKLFYIQKLILLQEFSKKYYNYKAHPVQAPSSNCSPCLQALHTAGSSYKAPYSIPGPYSTSRLPVILGGRISILHGSQHPRSPYSSSQAHSYKNSTKRFFPKGLSIVYPIQY